MATSETAICNSALTKVGAARIASLSDNSKEAKLCKEQYEKVRDDLLRSHPWNFAKKRVKLTPLTVAPEFGFSAQFQLPADCLRVLSIIEFEDLTEWRREGNKILCDESTLSLLYIEKVTDTTKFDANFDEVFALKLAHDICYALTQSTTLKQALGEEFKQAIRDARTFDAQESSPRVVFANDFINQRF